MRDAAHEDDIYQELLREWMTIEWKSTARSAAVYALHGWTAIENDLVLKGDCIVVPEGAQEYLLVRFHFSHISINDCISWARDAVFCQQTSRPMSRNASRATPISWQMHVSRCCRMMFWASMNAVSTDIFQYLDYNRTVDYLSGFSNIDRLPSKRISDVI